MKQHFKAIIWPKEPKVNKNNNIKCYRYIIVGMIVTDKPLEKFEGKNEIFLDGESSQLAEAFQTINNREPKMKVGDATDVILSLNEL